MVSERLKKLIAKKAEQTRKYKEIAAKVGRKTAEAYLEAEYRTRDTREGLGILHRGAKKVKKSFSKYQEGVLETKGLATPRKTVRKSPKRATTGRSQVRNEHLQSPFGSYGANPVKASRSKKGAKSQHFVNPFKGF